jgi:hypothetical protein
MNPRTPSAADLRARVLAAVRREPALPRPADARRRVSLVTLGFAAALFIALVKQVLEATMPRGARLWHIVADGGVPTQDRPLGFAVTLEVVWLVIALVATWAGVTRGGSMLGRSSTSKLAVALVTPVALVATWLTVAVLWLKDVLPLAWLEVMDEAPSFQFHANCALASAAYAVGPLFAFLAMRRHRDPVSPRKSGAALGAVAGAWGAVVHFPFCSCTSPLHMALGHVLPVVVLAVAGAVLGDRILGVHAAPAYGSA